LKSSSSSLWQLIKSLSGPEKTFFKRNFSGGKLSGEKLYLKLFDALAMQKEYSEPALLKKFAPEINKKNFAFQKHYLQTQVCDALVQYYSRNNVYQEIYKQIQLIRVYRKKGLLDEAHTIWKKTVEKARQTESFAMLNLLKTEFEKMLLFSSTHISYDEFYLLFRKNAISYPEYADMITLRDIYTETILLKKKSHFDIDDELRLKIEQLLSQVSKYENATVSPSFWFRHYYYLSKATLLYLLNDIPGSFKLLQSAISDWKNNSHFIRMNGEFYIELLYMINYTGILNGSFSYVTSVFNDKLTAQIEDAVQRANFEAIKYLALNKIHNKTAHYEDVKKLIANMKTQYQQWEPLLNADMNRTVNLSLGIASFVLEQYSDALYYTKRAVTWFKDGTREEQFAVAYILLLLITYNMNNSRLFDAQYRTTYNYFYKKKKKHPFETALVQCLHRSFYMTDSKSKVKEYEKALLVFEQNKEDQVQQMAFNIFNYPGWLISKVQRISYRQYVEKKVKSENIPALL
jgi:hypothetical protein